jgi:hypothetical protein
MDPLEKAIQLNLLEQKKRRKKNYTKPSLFLEIETFIQERKLIGYGGTAIHHALPKEAQFYDSSEIPDYDFFSKRAMQDIRDLADRLRGYHVEVKPALFQGTYKLFVNYLPLVDITEIEDELYENLWISSFTRNKIHYVPYNYLRMSIYQELSRPLGDVSRWTKIFKRLDLLNLHQPFLVRKCDVKPLHAPNPLSKSIATLLKSYVMLGDYTMYYWQDLFPKEYRYPQQDTLYILSKTIEEIWSLLKGYHVRYHSYKNKLLTVYEIYIEEHPMLYVLLSDSCANYNVYKQRNIATYDTTMSLYFALSFMNIKHLSKSRILSYCYLLSQIKDTEHPLMKRFSLPCYGDQQTLEEIRKKRERYFQEKKHSSYFFHYRPKHTKDTNQIRRTKKLTRKKR